jgi:hypothetical protein
MQRISGSVVSDVVHRTRTLTQQPDEFLLIDDATLPKSHRKRSPAC